MAGCWWQRRAGTAQDICPRGKSQPPCHMVMKMFLCDIRRKSCVTEEKIRQGWGAGGGGGEVIGVGMK